MPLSALVLLFAVGFAKLWMINGEGDWYHVLSCTWKKSNLTFVWENNFFLIQDFPSFTFGHSHYIFIHFICFDISFSFQAEFWENKLFPHIQWIIISNKSFWILFSSLSFLWWQFFFDFTKIICVYNQILVYLKNISWQNRIYKP